MQAASIQKNSLMSTARKIRTVTPLSRHGNLSDRIYMELRQRLQRAVMGPDERLLDLEVAAAYGTSRMPARDALLRLANEGYLIGTTRGFVAPTLSLDDVREIFEVRRMLEPAAIAGVAQQIDAAAVTELTAALQRARQAALDNDGEAMTLANRAFRDAWLSRVNNKRLAATIARFVDHVQTVRINTLGSAETRQVVVDGMERLHEALVNRDNVLARQRMVEFMTAAEHAYFSFRKAEIANSTPAPIAPGQAIT
jgi:DNA-binding GntR family transcriptional regulator